MLSSQRKLFFPGWAVVLLVGGGTAGYHIIEEWPWFDCFYMTIITLTTIGYSEPENMSDAGRYFTSVLIIFGVGTVGYTISLVAQSAIQGELLSIWERRRVKERLNKLKDHVIICGAGRVGTRVARGLASEDSPFVVVEYDREKAEEMAQEGWLVVAGDATQERILIEAGIDRARGLVCALPTDADNVFIVLTARDLANDLMIVARVNNESTIPKMRKAGASKVVSPLRTGASQIIQALLRPTVHQFIELATETDGLDLIIEEVLVSSTSQLGGKSLRESNIRSELDVILIAILRGTGEMLFNPTADTLVQAGDKIIAIGNRSGVEGLAELAGAERAVKRGL